MTHWISHLGSSVMSNHDMQCIAITRSLLNLVNDTASIDSAGVRLKVVGMLLVIGILIQA